MLDQYYDDDIACEVSSCAVSGDDFEDNESSSSSSSRTATRSGDTLAGESPSYSMEGIPFATSLGVDVRGCICSRSPSGWVNTGFKAESEFNEARTTKASAPECTLAEGAIEVESGEVCPDGCSFQ
jgi:hypothetical protein